MGVSLALAEQHIRHWQAALKYPIGYSYRQRWPRYLFRHERVENAAAILRAGALSCRSSLREGEFVDVAPADIIAARAQAHHFARLYFRPKTPTQYRIEGIKKPEEWYRGCHAPVLISFVFHAKSVLCNTATNFSDGNMQSPAANTGDDDAFFHRIPFDRVYHDGSFQAGSDEGNAIVHARCAEVLAPSPLQLEGNLATVLCRSSAERQTLLHLAGRLPDNLISRIRVFAELGIFDRKFVYVESVALTVNGLIFFLHPRVDSAPVDFRAEVTDRSGEIVLRSANASLDASRKWIVRKGFEPGRYRTTIWLEGEIAYQAITELDELPF